MPITKKAQIAWRASEEVKAVRLARRYANTKDYNEAAAFYRAAAFHRAVREALEQQRR